MPQKKPILIVGDDSTGKAISHALIGHDVTVATTKAVEALTDQSIMEQFFAPEDVKTGDSIITQAEKAQTLSEIIEVEKSIPITNPYEGMIDNSHIKQLEYEHPEMTPRQIRRLLKKKPKYRNKKL